MLIKHLFCQKKFLKKEKIVRENDLSSNDTLLLLANNEKQQEVNILKQIGLDNHIREVETKHNDLTRIEVIQRNIKPTTTHQGSSTTVW